MEHSARSQGRVGGLAASLIALRKSQQLAEEAEEVLSSCA